MKNTSGHNHVVFSDKVLPNKKYYYTFRSVDVHGYFSNPTCIYCVEMRSDNGLVYPIIKPYDLGTNRDIKVPTKPFKKFLEIKPHFDQLYLNFDASGIDGEKNITVLEGTTRRISSLFPTDMGDFTEGSQFVLGDSGNPDQAWGKRFKIRLTSKHSGRKIDLNVRFDYRDLVKKSDFYIKDREN